MTLLREIARRFALHGRRSLAGASGLATLAAMAALGASPALAASATVGIATSYEQTPISLNTSDSIGFKITNTTSAAVTNLTFTDTLPAGVTLDNPIGLTNTAGSSTTCGATTATNPTTGDPSAPGDSAVTITIASVPALASGTVCTISLGIVGAQASVSDSGYSDSLSSTLTPAPKLTPASLVILSNPAITLTRPTNGLRLRFGQIYDANFSCAATDPLDSINQVFADDGDGNQVDSGEPIDTVDAGPNTFEVDCYSAVGGGQFSQTVDYSVKPYTLESVVAGAGTGNVAFKASLPAGRGVAELLDGRKVIGKTIFRLRAAKTAKVAVTPDSAGQSLLAASGSHGIKAKLEVSYTPRAIGSGQDAITPQAPTVVARNVKLVAAS